MFCVYVLESQKASKRYIGLTKNLTERLTEHNKGENISTKPYIPYKCIYCEYCTNYKDAERREKYLKTTQGRWFLNRRLREYLS